MYLQGGIHNKKGGIGSPGDEFMGGCSWEGWQGRRVFPPPVGGGTSKRVLLQECPGPPSATGA